MKEETFIEELARETPAGVILIPFAPLIIIGILLYRIGIALAHFYAFLLRSDNH